MHKPTLPNRNRLTTAVATSLGMNIASFRRLMAHLGHSPERTLVSGKATYQWWSHAAIKAAREARAPVQAYEAAVAAAPPAPAPSPEHDTLRADVAEIKDLLRRLLAVWSTEEKNHG